MTIQSNSSLCSIFSCGCRPSSTNWRDFIDSAGGTYQGTSGTTYGLRSKCAGGTVGNNRGENSVDFSSTRGAVAQVAAGPCSVIMGGICNTVGTTSIGASIFAGCGNLVGGCYSSVLSGTTVCNCSNFAVVLNSVTAAVLSSTTACFSSVISTGTATMTCYATVLVSGNSGATACYSTTIAHASNAQAPFSTAFGNAVTTVAAAANYSVGIGIVNGVAACSNYSTAIGNNSLTFGVAAISFGLEGLAATYACGNHSVAIGNGCNIALKNCSQAFGCGAQTDYVGELSYSNGMFGTTKGSSQIGHVQFFGQTTDSVLTEIFIDGTSTRMVIPANCVYGFTLTMSAFRDDSGDKGQAAGYVFHGAIKNVAGVVTLLNSTYQVDFSAEDGIESSSSSFNDSSSSSLINESSSSSSLDSSSSSSLDDWECRIEADDTNDALVVKVRGGSGQTVKWHGKLTYSKTSA